MKIRLHYFLITGLLLVPTLLQADDCATCTRISSATKKDLEVKHPIVMRRMREGKKGGTGVVLYEPKLAGIRKVLIGGKISENLFQDTDSYLYEGIFYPIKDAAPRKLLQRLRNTYADGVRGELKPLEKSTQAELARLFDERFLDLSGEQRIFCTKFLLESADAKNTATQKFCAWSKEIPPNVPVRSLMHFEKCSAIAP